MNTITINNADFNSILSQFKKIDIHQFAAWYESLAPEYYFIKDKKKTFTKNSKNIYSCQGLKSINLGEDISWEKVFFTNHHSFLDAFTTILQKNGFDYWKFYSLHIFNLPNKPIHHTYNIVCYAVENPDFFEENKEPVTELFATLIEQSKLGKNKDYIEKVVNIFEFLLGKPYFTDIWIINKLNELYPYFPSNQKEYFLKSIFNNKQVSNLQIEDKNIHPDIMTYIKKAKNYTEEIGTGFYFSINLNSFSIDYKLSQAELTINFTNLQQFIANISEEQRIFWFIDSYFKSSTFTINAFPKNDEALFFLQDFIDLCLNEYLEHQKLSIMLEAKYMEISTPSSKNEKKQEINKF